MLYCGKQVPLEDRKPTRTRPPYVLSGQNYNRLWNVITAKERQEQEDAEEQKYKKWEKNAGEALKNQYTGKKLPTLAEKLALQKAELDKKTEMTLQTLKMFKQNDENKRLEKLKKAERLLEKLKPQSRQLDSAALQSEILRERNAQIAIKAEFDKAVQEEDKKISTACNSLNNPWVPDETAKITEHALHRNNYKKELKSTIQQLELQRHTQYKTKLEQERKEREVVDKEVKEQIEKERLAMERKKEVLRKNAIEAMKMAEQRRIRNGMVEEVEDRLNCVFNIGKSDLTKMLKANEAKAAAEKEKLTDLKYQRFLQIQSDNTKAEEERRQRDINQMELKFTELELEKKNKEKAAKKARIEAYLRHREEEKRALQLKCEEKRFDMATRFKNAEVNCKFAENERKKKFEQFKKSQAELKKQLEEQMNRPKDKPPCSCAIIDPHMKEDLNFFERAKDYIEEAQKHKRPLYPLAKAVEKYKIQNNIDCGKDLPKHLVSHLTIGTKKASGGQDSENPCGYKKKSEEQQKQIIEECKNINEIIKKNLNEPSTPCFKNQRLCAGAEPQSSINQDATINSTENISSADNTKKKYCYSITDLKRLNKIKYNTKM